MNNHQGKYLSSSKTFKGKDPKKMIRPLFICHMEQSKNLYTKFFFANMVCKFDQIKLVYTITQCHS